MRILFLTPRFPYPPLKGDTLRVFHQLRTLSREHSITLLSISEGPVSIEERDQVQPFCERIDIVTLPRWRALFNAGAGLAAREPLQVRYYRASRVRVRLASLLGGERFDVIHATLIRVLPYVWNIRSIPVVVDLIDSLSLNLADRSESVRGLRGAAYALEYERVRRYERAVVKHFQTLVVSSEADRQVLEGEHITVIPNGVDTDTFSFHPREGRHSQTVIFTGNMAYHPNEEAVLWFANEVWPSLVTSMPGVRFQVVGTNPTDRVKALAASDPRIEVAGKVGDLAGYLGRATAAVAPMRSGSGIQNKVLEAMATGTPVVATSIANRGVGGEAGRELLVADTAEEFAASVRSALEDRGLREQLGNAGRALVEREYRWESHARRLSDIYEHVHAASPVPLTARSG